MKVIHGILSLSLCIPMVSAYAYDPATHADMSGQAAQVSDLNNPSKGILSDLGLPPSIQVPQQFPNSRGDNLSIAQLISSGAILEDAGRRPLNHFFDPIQNRALTVLGIAPGVTSPGWALEDKGQINTNVAGTQDRSFVDARTYLYGALTASGAADRKKFFGLTFQSMGQVIHHVQDMAQPQHVRNDAHLDEYSLLGLNPLYAPSLYEKWTALQSTLPFTGYAPPYSATNTTTYNEARKFWTTPDRLGLADFTNRNFVSAGTNFDKPGLYPSPLLDESKRINLDIRQLCGGANSTCPNPNLQGVITFYGSDVNDGFTGETVQNPFTSSLSIFDTDLQRYTGNPLGQPRLFSLNQFNFKVAHAYLIPRAVAYSAGLINYFFRGKLEVEGQGATQMLVKNTSKEAMLGDVGLYYDDAQEVRRPVTITACTIGGVDIAVVDGKCKGAALAAANPDPDVPLQVNFFPPTAPAQKTSGEYMVVFSGDLGEEKAGDGSIGAVVAKQIRTVGGALYIRAIDNRNQPVYLIADVSGTREIAPGTEFHPLNAVSGLTDRSYIFRHVRFKEVGPGVHAYEPLAITVLPSVSNTTRTYLKNADTNRFDQTSSANFDGQSWRVKSPQPEIGEFTFILRLRTATVPNDRLQYLRRYRDPEGNAATSTGFIVLPNTLNGYPTATNFLFVSSDVLRVSGFVASLYTFTDPMIHYDIVINLGPTPTFNVVETARDLRINKSDTQQLDDNIGTLSTTSPACQNVPGITMTSRLGRRLYRVENQSTYEITQFIGYFNNKLASYRSSNSRYFLALGDVTSGRITGPSYPGCNIWALIRDKGIVHQVETGDHKVTFADKENIHSVTKNGVGTTDYLNTLFPGRINRAWEYDYEGYLPATTAINFKNLDVSESKSGQPVTVSRALTEKFSDAIIDRTFRGVYLGDKPFVADASPLGEIFLATKDLQIVIHEPKGGAPKIVIPPNVVQILAAVWF